MAEYSLAPSHPDTSLMHEVIIKGDLSSLSPDQRAAYYMTVCQSVGLNPLTKPFEYIKLNGKLVLYAQKGATDQLRGMHKIGIGKPDIQFVDGLVIVAVTGRDAAGREDSDVGAVPLANLQGEARANAIMKAITKAKRRLTLSMCGLGMLDELEVETIPSASITHVDTVTGEIVDMPNQHRPAPVAYTAVDGPALREGIVNESKAKEADKRNYSAVFAAGKGKGLNPEDVKALAYYQCTTENVAVDSMTQLTTEQLIGFTAYLNNSDSEDLIADLADAVAQAAD